MNIIQKQTQTVTLSCLRLNRWLAEQPLIRRVRALYQGQINTALGREEGQGLLEYIIAIAGVFVVAAAVLALYRAIRDKYGQATNSVNSLSITAP